MHHPLLTPLAVTCLGFANNIFAVGMAKPLFGAAPPPTKAERRTVSIADFGAVPDGELQTGKIQAAIDDRFLHGGGEVQIPAGKFRTGGLRLRSGVTLRLLRGAVLCGSRNPEDYAEYLVDKIEPLDPARITTALWRPASDPDRNNDFMRTVGSRWNNALIRAIDAENISIIGDEGSVIDGSDCYDETGEEHYRGPHCIGMHNCRGITLRGYTVKNSANWAHAIFFSQGITAENITVLAGHYGIHLSACYNIKIDRCHFYTGDDCVGGPARVAADRIVCPTARGSQHRGNVRSGAFRHSAIHQKFPHE